MLSEINVSSYLTRVTAKQPEISLSFMKRLQDAHVGNFPFSSLGVLLHDSLVNNLVVSRKLYDDVRLLKNSEFYRIGGGETTITKILSKDNLGMILTQEFGIMLMLDQLSMLYEGYCK